MSIRFIISRIIKKCLPPPICKHLIISDFYKYEYSAEMWGGGIFSDNVEKALKMYLSADEVKNSKDRKRLIDDIVWCYKQYGATPEEYFVLGYRGSSKSVRSSILSDKDKDIACLSTMSYERFTNDLTNKYNFFQNNKVFFGRNAWELRTTSNIENLINEIKCDRLFIKPLEGTFGIGAHIFKIESKERLKNHLFELKNKGNWILEEVINQDSRMSVWNKTSVNTLRIPSFWVNGRSVILGPVLRTGRNGAVVDNNNSGGIIAGVDLNTGIIISDGTSKTNQTYEVHPDSGIRFKGFQIPKWEELKEFTQKVHKNMPGHKYIAFDVALTPAGWVLIEGNWGQMLWQNATKQGIKEEFLRLMNAPV